MPGVQAAETGRCRHGCLEQRQRGQRRQREQGRVTFVSFREVSCRESSGIRANPDQETGVNLTCDENLDEFGFISFPTFKHTSDCRWLLLG